MQKPLEVFPHPLGFFPYFTALQENLKMHLFELVYNPFEVLDTNKEKKLLKGTSLLVSILICCLRV